MVCILLQNMELRIRQNKFIKFFLAMENLVKIDKIIKSKMEENMEG